MEYDFRSILQGRKYPTLIASVYGELLRKTNHKVLRHPYLRKGADLSNIIFDGGFCDFTRLSNGEKTEAVLKLYEEFEVVVERHETLVIISVVGEIKYDLSRPPIFDSEGSLLIRQSVLKFKEPYIPLYSYDFCPANGFSIACHIARRMFDGGVMSFVANYEDSNYAAYGDERRFYEVISSMIALSVESDIGDRVFAGGVPMRDGYRIAVTSKVYEETNTENKDTPEEIDEELTMIRRIAKENYWLFSAHMCEGGIMELSLELPTHGYQKLLVLTKDKHRNFPAIIHARFGRVRHKGRPY